MKGRGERPPPADPVANRCRCGHFPTTHMKVLPIADGNGAGFRLEPVGGCAICRESICPRFTPSV